MIKTMAMAATFVGSATAFAVPLNVSGVAIEPVRLVCDEFRRCWRTGTEYIYPSRHSPRAYGYDGYRRPATQWEQKGFCPPGQRKKGNC
jgi:hypothetical protein